MLSIKRETVKRDITIGDLFYELGIQVAENIEVMNDFDIKVSSASGFEKIEGFRCSERLPVHRLLTICSHIDAAAKHLMLTCDASGNIEWLYLEDIRPGYHTVLDENLGWIDVIENCIHPDGNEQILFDLQVTNTHCFFTNGILSHNSHFLVQLGANALKAGKNVLHYTFELRENKLSHRYDSNLCCIPASDVPESKDFILKRYEELRPNLGRLIVKEYPTNSASVLTLRSHIEKLSITKQFIPDVIIVDYADIMRSTRQFDSLRHELKLIYEELRGMGMDLGIPVWTASQSNRESTNQEIVGTQHMAESFAKAMVCDFVITLSRKPLQKINGLGNLFVAKNRLGRDGILFPVRLDTALSTFEVLEGEVDLEDLEKSSAAGAKKLLKDKWAEVGNDRLVELRKAEG